MNQTKSQTPLGPITKQQAALMAAKMCAAVGKPGARVVLARADLTSFEYWSAR